MSVGHGETIKKLKIIRATSVILHSIVKEINEEDDNSKKEKKQKEYAENKKELSNLVKSLP